jgi:hypothetical protein
MSGKERASGSGDGWFRKIRRNVSFSSKSRGKESTREQFPFFNDLTDELQLYVVSFVADAPYENVAKGTNTSTLTDTLPLVSRKFYAMAQSDNLWRMALRRAINSDEMWKRAALASSVDVINDESLTNHQELYKQLFDAEIAFTGPVFIMSMVPRFTKGEIQTYQLYFFEPRYVYMTERLLERLQEWEESDPDDRGPNPPPLYFLHANTGLPYNGRETTAFLVKLVRYARTHAGHFAVTLEVESLVSMEHFWVMPNTGHLHYAYGRRIPIEHED